MSLIQEIVIFIRCEIRLSRCLATKGLTVKNLLQIIKTAGDKDYYYGYESVDGKQMPGYVDMIEDLQNGINHLGRCTGRKDQEERCYGCEELSEPG